MRSCNSVTAAVLARIKSIIVIRNIRQDKEREKRIPLLLLRLQTGFPLSDYRSCSFVRSFIGPPLGTINNLLKVNKKCLMKRFSLFLSFFFRSYAPHSTCIVSSALLGPKMKYNPPPSPLKENSSSFSSFFFCPVLKNWQPEMAVGSYL